MSDEFQSGVEQHWYDGARGQLIERIGSALIDDGKDLDRLTIDDLTSVDEFHIRGREATSELASLAAIKKGDRVLDVGSGLGGPARYLAAEHGCDVTGIDLTAEYCDVANTLAQWVGLADRVKHRQADALELPFEDESFDVAWTQHISMNISDKNAFFAEMQRVVRPGGKLVIYDPVKGDDRPLEFPVPWSRDGRISFLIKAEETRQILESQGLDLIEWYDASEKSRWWFAANAERAQKPSALGVQLLLGDEWRVMAANTVKNLAEGRIAVIQVVARRR